MSWWNDSHRHALARLGIKTASGVPREVMGRPIPESRPSAKRVSKQRLSALDNQLQDNVHKLGSLVRRVSERGRVNEEEVVSLQAFYDGAKVRALEYGDLKGSLPLWTNRDWVGQENWRGGGRVQGLLERARTVGDAEQRKTLGELNNVVNRPRRV